MAKKRKHVLPTEDVPLPDPWAVLYEGLTTKQEIMENLKERIVRPIWDSLDPTNRTARRRFLWCWNDYWTALLESKGESMEAFLQRFQFGIVEDDIADWYQAAIDGKREDWREIRKRMHRMLDTLRKEKDGT